MEVARLCRYLLQATAVGIFIYQGELEALEEGGEFYEPAGETLTSRTKRELLGKVSWYKEKI